MYRLRAMRPALPLRSNPRPGRHCSSHRGIERQNFRAPAYKRADIGLNFRAIKDGKGLKNLWLGVDCLNLFGISNVNSYYWVTDVSSRQWAVPNYLTGRQINGKVTFEF